MQKKWIAKGIKIALMALVGCAVFGWIVMSLWNWLMPVLFGWHIITFWQALGLFALCRILFGDLGMRARGPHGPNVRKRIEERMAERWEKMTPEERERARQSWRGRCGFGPPTSESTGQ